jgi:guanylate kinase
MNKNKNILLLFDGPSGAGQTTLINIIARWKNFELMNCATTRKKRPSDGLELECMGFLKFYLQRLESKIILPQIYARNKKWYGIKKASLEKLQVTNLVGAIYPDWKIIDELRKEYNVIAIFLSAKKEILKERLLERSDCDKQRNECIKYIPIQLREYERNKHRFDYYLENNTTLGDLEDRVKEILNKHKV